jgi:hypothetical protein
MIRLLSQHHFRPQSRVIDASGEKVSKRHVEVRPVHRRISVFRSTRSRSTAASSPISRSPQAVVNIAAARRMTATAEGVETVQQQELLALGCAPKCRGYLFRSARAGG